MTSETVAVTISAVNPQTQNSEVLELEPVPSHDGWRCGCHECVDWRKRNEPLFRRLVGRGFSEWLATQVAQRLQREQRDAYLDWLYIDEQKNRA